MPSDGIFASRPDVAKGMAEVYKQSAKLDGMPITETIVMGGPEQPGAATDSGSTPPPQQRQQQQTQERPSIGGALGGALGGKLGLGRKKDTQPPPDQSQQQQASSSGSAPGSLLEMTTEMSGFSSGPVDASLFEVPAGFKKVEAKTAR